MYLCTTTRLSSAWALGGEQSLSAWVGEQEMSSGMLGRALPPLPGQLKIDFFLPTGIMVTILVSPESTLREMKDMLFKEAKRYPLFSLLKDQGFYNFVGKLAICISGVLYLHWYCVTVVVSVVTNILVVYLGCLSCQYLE